MRRSFVVVTLLAGLAACKGDRQKCEEACRNFATLAYWGKADAEIAAAPAEQREALKKRKLAEFTHQLESGVEMCVNQCSSANNDDQTDCMIAAKTADEAMACVKNDD
jgi:hypothetical protein